MHTIRIFFAIELSLDIKNKLNEIIMALKKMHSQPYIRWSKPDHLHITLQFLAAVKPEDLLILLKEVRKELKSLSGFHLALRELELFPPSNRPHIISMKIEPQEILADLSKHIGNGILHSGYEIEQRPFKGHITLARLNRREKSFQLANIELPKFEKMIVKEIVLYQSEPTQEGSNYITLERITL